MISPIATTLSFSWRNLRCWSKPKWIHESLFGLFWKFLSGVDDLTLVWGIQGHPERCQEVFSSGFQLKVLKLVISQKWDTTSVLSQSKMWHLSHGAYLTKISNFWSEMIVLLWCKMWDKAVGHRCEISIYHIYHKLSNGTE